MADMPNSPKLAVLPGRRVTLHGNADDPYFQNAEGVLAAKTALHAWARRNLPPDAVIIDAGGNIGLTALILSALVPNRVDTR